VQRRIGLYDKIAEVVINGSPKFQSHLSVGMGLIIR
jgi:hypothetical protein